jgi:SAM-dependent methyltransferase
MPPGIEDAAMISAIAGPGGSVLELGAGAGRVTHPLIDLGHPVTAVDDSMAMLGQITGAETVLAGIEGLDLHRRFDVVVLGSHLVNVPDDNAAVSLLGTCARHVSVDGAVLIERWPPGWFDKVKPARFEDEGIEYEFSDISRPSPDLLGATVTYRRGEQTWTQTFTTRRVTDTVLARLLNAVDLAVDAFVDGRQTWAVCSLR